MKGYIEFNISNRSHINGILLTKLLFFLWLNVIEILCALGGLCKRIFLFFIKL